MFYSDADDFEPETAQVADKIAALGIDTESKKDTPEVAAVKTEAGSKPAKSNAVKTNHIQGDLTEMQKRELQKRSDRDIALDLFGKQHGSLQLFHYQDVCGLRHGTGKREDDRRPRYC